MSRANLCDNCEKRIPRGAAHIEVVIVCPRVEVAAHPTPFPFLFQAGDDVDDFDFCSSKCAASFFIAHGATESTNDE